MFDYEGWLWSSAARRWGVSISGIPFTKYRREVTASAVILRPVNESSDGPPPPPQISYAIQEAGNALVNPLG
ncbi:hypothetical protein EVAR_100084_1 [Eumeta japonica]|uniref:Uncharacterized protein n=1 Tax=Eumeta variegata TaxID=151549 RepID=A0A4C1Z0R6_EUMVA|nr:hypothetical protein EVAR_100084_1 [Eumeta japonica]